MGCNAQTFGGLAGIGDLIVTATSVHSRNNRCGMLLGQGVKPQEAVKQVGMVVEGINALPAAMRLKEKYAVEMPIVEAVNAIVTHGAAPMDTVKLLMGRDKKPELPPAALNNSYDR
jgi:glycerol-3-phosphate dehydrogenase (NAD(P)+)